MAVLTLTGCTSLHSPGPEVLRFPELKTPPTPQYIREEMDNGMVVFLMEDRSLPLIRLQALVDTGSIYEPSEKTGLAEITLETLRTGGAGEMTGDEIDLALEGIGANISTGLDRDVGWVSGLSHKKDFPHVFNIFRNIITAPSFENPKIELSIIRKRGEISRRNDDISGIADREFRRILYGKESPYARIAEYKTIDNITRDDVTEFYNRYFHPDKIILGLWGDFDAKEMLEDIKKSFGGWKSVRTEVPVRPAVRFSEEGSINIIVKKDATQSVVVMGHRGLQRDHPDYFTAVVLSRILGAGCYSRFSRGLRQEKGLAYEIWASFLGEFSYPGMFIAKSQTRQEKTSEVIEEMKKEIDNMQVDVTEKELSIAKEGIINNEVFWLDTKGEIIQRLMRYEYYGYPYDYPQKMIEGIKKVTKEDVLRVAKEHLFPDRMTILVVGNPERFDAPLPVGTNIINLTP